MSNTELIAYSIAFFIQGFMLAWFIFPYYQQRMIIKMVMDKTLEHFEKAKEELKPIPTEPVKIGRKVKFQTNKIK